MSESSPRRWRRLLEPPRARPERVVEDELRFHLEMRVQEYVRRGLAPEVARAEAMKRFGDLEAVRDECRHLQLDRERSAMRTRMIDDLWQDVRWAARTLFKRPLFVITAVLTLGLGIGANTAIFSVVNGLLLRPLPVRDPGSIMVLGQMDRSIELPIPYLSFPTYRDVRDERTIFADVAATSAELVGLRPSAAGEAEPRFVEAVTGNYFSMLGLRPVLGRMISEDDDRTRAAVVVLGYSLWQTRFASDPSVIGRRVEINRLPFTVIGVAPEPFHGTQPPLEMSGYLPLGATELLDPGRLARYERRGPEAATVRALARLGAGVPLAKARTAMNVLGTRLQQQYADETRGLSLLVVPESRARPTLEVSGMMPWAAGVFMALVGLVLLIACVNVANLTLARATARRPEIALRHALGASRSRVARQLLTESVLVSVLGLALGAALAIAALRWLGDIRMGSDLPIRFPVDPDWRVFVYSVVVAVGAGLLTGLSPALRGARADAGEVLRESGRGAIGTRQRGRSVLVVAQLAVSLVLLICAGLFARSVSASTRIDLGFRRDHLLLSFTDLSLQRYDTARSLQFARRLEREARAIPGVKEVALSGSVPLGFNIGSAEIYPDAGIPGNREGHVSVMMNNVSSGYFATMGIPLREGRAFASGDTAGAPLTAIVNRTAAERYWPGRSPIGRHLRLRSDGPPIEIVGVARDSKSLFVNEGPRPFVYFPLEQQFRPQVNLALHTAGDPAAMASAARQAFHAIDPELTVFDVKTMETHLQLGQAYFFMRLAATLATVVGLIGLVQTMVGLYGVIAYGVAQRTREFGIRMALGALPRDVIGGVLRRGLVMAATGVAIGVLLSLLITSAMAGLLVGVGAHDPLTFVAAAGALLLLALLSTFVPAWRAARLAALAALRED